MDILVVDHNAPAQFRRSDTRALGRRLGLQALENGPNRDAIGGWIEVKCGDRVQRRELTVGGGHASGQLTWVHFGLGAAREAEARVIWPDGVADAWRPIAADGFRQLRRGAGALDAAA